MWFSRLLNAAVLQQLKSLRTHFLLCLFWVRVVPLLNPLPHPTMNSPLVNFKLKPGISRSLTGAALLVSAAALINAGESKSATIECFLSDLSACGGILGDKDFTGFEISGYMPNASDKVTVMQLDDVWQVDVDLNSFINKTGTLKYNVAVTGTNFTFNETSVSVSGSTNATLKPTVASTMTGTPTGIEVFTTNTAASQTRTFTTKPTSIAVSQVFTAAPARSINSFTTTYTQNVPGPLPLLGAAAAFGFSRRLRSRIKTSASA